MSRRAVTAVVVGLSLLLRLVVGICPSQCECDDETLVVTCEGANLEVVPITLNPGVRRLVLRYNAIRAVVASLTFYKDLSLLDLSHNRLASLESRCFEAQTRLRELHLSRNLIAAVTGDTFYGLDALRVLHLDANLLKELSGATFAHLRTLDELDLSANRLATIRQDAFDGLAALRTLRLGNNRLTRVPATLGTLRALTHLHLDNNPLGDINASAFADLPGLVEMSLHGCRLRHLAAGALAGLAALLTLRLGDNELERIPAPLEWAHVPRLEELTLGGNAFDELPTSAFAGLGALRALQVNAAPNLRVVRARAFAANPALQVLALGHNPRLELLEARAFDGLPHLRHLALRENALRTLSVDAMPQLAALESLDVRDNPLDCNCSLLWLHRFLGVRNATATPADPEAAPFPSPKCRSPASFFGVPLATLEAAELTCDGAEVRQVVLVAAVTAAATVCLAMLVVLVYRHHARYLQEKFKADGGGVSPRAKRCTACDPRAVDDDDDDDGYNTVAVYPPIKHMPVTEL